ncbi:MAG TPA: NFACT RNA binding domain-containing protein [Myxococcaceae bacterium]|nr:NFACT RNA binding domain-containing protein [Myxococcaceae bacterium]
MSLRPDELREVAEALGAELAGAVVQKVRAPWPERLELELRSPGRTVRLLLSVESGLGRLSVIEARTLSTSDTGRSPWLLRARKELTGRRLSTIRCTGPRQVRLGFEKGNTVRWVVAELGSPGVLLLLGDGDAPLAASRGPARAPAPPAETVSESGPASRLGGASGLEAGRAAEALVAARESVVRREALQRARIQPLRSTLRRLRRTRAKVEAEANRDVAAEEHRRWGELLSRALDRIPRGARSVRLTEWTEAGPREVEVPLEPTLAPRAQVERHFHQYRRLLRGSALARERLAAVDREIAGAERALAEAEASTEAELAAPVTPVPARPPRKRAVAAHRPYRVFKSAGGKSIWVGRAGEDNAALSFQVARPHHLWMHARGVPGAHVVVPLARGEEVEQETLLDAAHLALHFSRMAGEPRGEVAWTRARLVKRVKGGAPGQVTYTGEKVLGVRMEPGRLERLLRAREEP